MSIWSTEKVLFLLWFRVIKSLRVKYWLELLSELIDQMKFSLIEFGVFETWVNLFLPRIAYANFPS